MAGEPDRHLGFTGTRRGMTDPQLVRVTSVLLRQRGWLHHGDCQGADAQVHEVARGSGLLVAVHPPTNPTLRAYCRGDVMHEPKAYLERDRDIVDLCLGLIATPGEFEEQLRSGTWATIRYAKRKRKPLLIVFPDGSIDSIKYA